MKTVFPQNEKMLQTLEYLYGFEYALSLMKILARRDAWMQYSLQIEKLRIKRLFDDGLTENWIAEKNSIISIGTIEAQVLYFEALSESANKIKVIYSKTKMRLEEIKKKNLELPNVNNDRPVLITESYIQSYTDILEEATSQIITKIEKALKDWDLFQNIRGDIKTSSTKKVNESVTSSILKWQGSEKKLAELICELVFKEYIEPNESAFLASKFKALFYNIDEKKLASCLNQSGILSGSYPTIFLKNYTLSFLKISKNGRSTRIDKPAGDKRIYWLATAARFSELIYFLKKNEWILLDFQIVDKLKFQHEIQQIFIVGEIRKTLQIENKYSPFAKIPVNEAIALIK